MVQAVTFSLWALYTLDLLSLRGPVIEKASDVLTATLVLGSLQLSLGQVLVFALTVWATLLLSRFLRFFLEEDVYPRFQLARGVPYVISTMLHYVVLVIGADTQGRVDSGDQFRLRFGQGGEIDDSVPA